ncbi:hypothetical protein D3C84_1069390 [compost metagenome]
MPAMIQPAVRGETSSWSKVPSSRSRATDRAVTMRQPMVVMMATREGSTCQRNSMLGL